MNEDIVLAEEFSRILAQKCREYTDEVCEKVTDGLEKIGKEAVSEVKSLSPVYKGTYKKLKKGTYKRGWTYQVDQSRGKIQVTVYNRKYQLVHLLEKGHLTRKGTGRTAGKGKDKTRAFPHVEPVDTHAEEKVNALLERVANGTI